MKKRDLTIPVLGILIALSIVEIGFMVYWIYSEPQGPIIIADYELTLSVTTDGRKVTFSGQLTHPTSNVNAKTIYIYHCTFEGVLTGNTTQITTTTTTGVGTYNVIYEEPNEGIYYYIAGYQQS